jgi:acetyltransferase-like isoleucine patch superfamily enzyme
LRRKAKGWLIRFRYAQKSNIKIARGLAVVRRMKIRGPGHVTIGEQVLIDGSSHSVTLYTYSRDADLTIGAGTFLNGTRFGCASRIRIGRNCILGDCRIADTNHHSIYPEKRDDPKYIKVRPVEIGDNCWIGAGAFILPGTRIRDGSTVAAGAVVMGRFPSRSVVAGNPAVVIMTLGDVPIPEFRPRSENSTNIL